VDGKRYDLLPFAEKFNRLGCCGARKLERTCFELAERFFRSI
jgi:hypothetical protein